jgi:type I restriction enzyme S subunit
MPIEKTNKYYPSLRFPAFQSSEQWKTKRLGDIAELYAGATPSTSVSEYWTEGTIPWMSSGEVHNGQIFVTEKKITLLGYDRSSTKMVPANSVIVALAGQGKTRGSVAITRISLCTNQSLCSILPNETYDSDYLYFFLKNQYETLRFISSGDGTRGGLNLQMLRDFLIPVPSLEEQQKIAECLSSIESYISSINEKVEQLKAHKKSLLQKLFPQRGQTVPEYRFSEFQKDSAWEKMKLGDVTTVINRRNKSNRSLPIYSISNKDGFVLQSEQFDGLDSESRGYDISLYKIVGRNTFAYNPARINIGSIGYSGNLKEVLISSLYVCFKTTDELDDEFLQCFLKTAEFNQAVENNVEGGIRSYLFYENFSRINISIPSLQEQKKIASTILSIDDVISKYTDKVSLLEDYKKGLMQQLFPAITK